MPTYVAGYYMTFTTTRALMAKLQIDDRGVEDEHLEHPINNWLAEQSRHNVLTGAICHPVTGQRDKEDGMLIMTTFLRVSRGDNPVVEEQERDIHVKDWLSNEGGVKPDEMEWMSLFDYFYLTRNGIRPECNDVHGHGRHVIFNTLDRDVIVRWRNSGKSLDDFVADEITAGRFQGL
jgi:hypothetical protein